MTRKTYCGNLLWQSGLTLLAPEYLDGETGMVYYNYRHYYPLVGRWVSRDPIQENGGVGLYGMCANNLVDKIDFEGLSRMISGHRRPMPQGSNKWSYYKTAREIMRLMEKLNALTDKSGNYCFSVELKDFMLAEVDDIMKDLKCNKDNVYIIAHGSLKVNGEIWKKWEYEWRSEDVVEEGFCRAGSNDFTPYDNFDGKVNPKNVMACFLSDGCRRVRDSLFGRRESSMIQMDSIFTMLQEALSGYVQNWQAKNGAADCKCPRKIIIYEGNGRGSKSFGTEEAMKCPLYDEPYYNEL